MTDNTDDKAIEIDFLFLDVQFSDLYADMIGNTPTKQQIDLLRKMMERANEVMKFMKENGLK